MKRLFTTFVFSSILLLCRAQSTLVFHTIERDTAGNLIPWYNPDHATTYDHDLQLIWNFWKNIPATLGNKYYMVDHSYSPQSSGNKIGGDQFAMALSSWSLYYQYTGDPDLITNMTNIADTYLANSLSGGSAAWPNIPFPSNYSYPTLALYDGDFILGAGYTQPDKAGSFAEELVTLFKITKDTSYLTAAINIANTLATKVQPGDSTTSPYPFKVNAQNGSVTSFLPLDNYTSNFVPIFRLFEDLTKMKVGDTTSYKSAYTTIKTWVQKYPQKNNKWGCFFEDIIGPSNTETNAVTMAWYILQHPDWDSTWQQDARGILDWTVATLGSHAYDTLGVTAIYEQTVDLKEGGSHTSRFGATELLYCEKTGDTSRRTQAIRQLDWATYLVDTSGQVRFSPREGSVWYTDGYGDYVRHYLRAMYADPAIAPANANHLLGSTSVVTSINYQPQKIQYNTYDGNATETLRLTSKPLIVKANGQTLSESGNLNSEGWMWTDYATGGVLKVRHDNATDVDILWNANAVAQIAGPQTLMAIYPNPTANAVTLNYTTGYDEPVLIELTDLTGRVIEKLTAYAIASGSRREISVETLQTGTYLVKLNSTHGTSTEKLTIIK